MPPRVGPDRRFFDVWSRFYDARLVQWLTYRPEHDAVIRALRAGSHARVLDVGCGTGLLAARIARDLPDATVVGCDFSIGMLGQARSNAPSSGLVRANALRLPFRSGTFDAVVSTEAFHWFPDQKRALSEFFRVLAPGGRALVTLVNPPLEVISHVTRAASRVAGEPLDWPTRGRMRRQTEAAGFRDVEQRAVFRVPFGLVMPSVLTVGVRPD